MTITATELVAHDILFRAGYIPISTDDKHSVKKAGDYIVDLAKKILQDRGVKENSEIELLREFFDLWDEDMYTNSKRMDEVAAEIWSLRKESEASNA